MSIQHHNAHYIVKNSIRDGRTPLPGEIVFNTMRYRRHETVQRSGGFHSKQCDLYKGPNNISRENNIEERENVCKLRSCKIYQLKYSYQ